MSSPDNVQAFAPGKIILLGEHAVVYDQPALAVPVYAVQVRVSARPIKNRTIIESQKARYTLNSAPLADELTNPLIRMVSLTAAHFNRPIPRAHYTISSTIPVASGLGSGAAVSAALGRATALLIGQHLPDSTLNALVYEVERIHHGTPSGIDNTVIVYGHPVYFIRGQDPQVFSSAKQLDILIGDTGIPAPTRESVGDVRKLTLSNPQLALPAIEQIGQLVQSARKAISNGDSLLLGQLMTKNHDLLQTLTVSSPTLDKLVDAAHAAGALGAKMSGGGRGGNMIALVTPNTRQAVEAALLASGAVRVIHTTLSPHP
jgi:mevalonate kinase